MPSPRWRSSRHGGSGGGRHQHGCCGARGRRCRWPQREAMGLEGVLMGLRVAEENRQLLLSRCVPELVAAGVGRRQCRVHSHLGAHGAGLCVSWGPMRVRSRVGRQSPRGVPRTTAPLFIGADLAGPLTTPIRVSRSYRRASLLRSLMSCVLLSTGYSRVAIGWAAGERLHARRFAGVHLPAGASPRRLGCGGKRPRTNMCHASGAGANSGVVKALGPAPGAPSPEWRGWRPLRAADLCKALCAYYLRPRLR